MKSAKIKWMYISAVVLLPAVVVFLLMCRPAYYRRVPPFTAGSGQRQVGLYLTHELLASIYNNSQRCEPFDAVITQKAINDVMSLGEWPQEFGGIKFFKPEVFFSTDRAVLVGAANFNAVELVLTVVAAAEFDAKGLLKLKLEKVRIGVLDVTLFAKMMAAGFSRRQFNPEDGENEDLRAKAVKSLLYGRPFEPVFSIDGKKVRVKKIDIVQRKAVIRIVPAGN